ncbi:hypothetical protein J437_LFUL004208 [Ladona fulva]|uniref:SH2 domain-containing protein n=1 Tax=Ladona fulva TaxID=123851 RepID=A0A8K0JYX8_LADFU|nr:hypothetical protein J437_LFUL004208 [Ladona fulva]
MADFLDSEAEESEEEAELDNYEKKKLKKLRAMDSDDDEEDEEDDEERIREELKDLIDDNPIEESDGDDSDGSGGSKKRKKGSDDEDDFDDRLEDEDYDLIEENLGVKVERRKRFKRLKRFQDEESDEEKGEEKEDERDAIANELFEGSDHEREDLDDERGSERGPRTDTERFDEEASEGEYSETDDFIVDDDGRPITEKRRKRKAIFSDAALQEAQDIFGVDFDFDEFEKYDDEYEEEEDEEEDEYIDDDEGEDMPRRRKPKKAIQKKATKTSIFEIYEPSELKRGHFTDLDHEIRVTDIPERMQLREVPVTSVPEGSDELDDEADWIYKQAFCRPSISSQDGPRGNENQERLKKGPQTAGKIKKALDFMRNQHLEVPFIAFYRKEYVQPELNINDLWKVYKYDEKWCQLRARKNNLIKLFEKMRNYQLDQLMKAPDAPIADNVRVMKDEDIDRLKGVQTVEELKDVYTHFLLYYSHEFPAMQEAWKQKQKVAAAERRSKSKKKKKRRKKKKAEGEDGEEGLAEEEGEDEENEEEDEEEDAEGEEGGEEGEEEPEEEDILESETLKRAVRSGPYTICRKAGLDGLAKKFGLSPEQFAENLRDNYQRHEVEQEPVEPSDVALEFTSSQFSSVEDVLRAAKFMVATQLSREPLVRKCVRETYFERAKITVRPTKKGMKEIDESHPCYSMKYVKNKPVRDLAGDQFLKLTLAEEDKLIEMKISEDIDGITTSSYIEEVKQLYYRDEFSKNVQDWNALRVECVDLALTQLLLPVLRKELQARLLSEARDSVLKSCCRKLYNWLKVAPYAVEFPDEDEEEWDTGKGGNQIRVMAVAYVPDLSQAAFACLVTSDRDCSDYLRLPHLLKRKDAWREDQKRQKEADLVALRNFIGTKKPHVICVGGESREAMMVAADLREIIGQLVEDEQFPQISVEICDNELAKIYANSIKGENDFRDYPMLLRQAISTARRMQDPLIEFSQLCTSDEEILCLRFHPLQEHIPKEELLEALSLEFVNRTNEVGVDINVAVQMPYTANLVQFVCGLGPRKGQALLKTLKQTNQRLENRTQLVTACHMGPKVFINCAGFIKIDTNSLGDSLDVLLNKKCSVLDGSRVHPETYEWARKMAVDALEYEDEDANPAGALEEILEAPERLKDLDLDAFAEELERQDPFYDTESEEKDLKTQEEANKMKQRLTYIKRVIVHPSFHNISYKEAEKIMEQMDQGEVIVRPSSKGADHLTVTWKVTDGIYQHVDVREEGKENAFSLGQSLWIGNEEFEDLDEIIARYVNPMAAHVRDALSFRYYRETGGGNRDKAEEYLKEEKKKNMSKIHYLISASQEYPGKFLLSYLPRLKIRHEYITVTPEGFRLRQQIFDSLGSLFRWFKEHFRDPIPGTPSTPRGGTTVGGGSTGRPTPYLNTPNISIATFQKVRVLAPYTPSGQTPFMTPYQTPHGSSQTPRYGQQTPSHHAVVAGGITPNSSGTPFLHPGAVTPGHRTPSHRTPHHHVLHQTPTYMSQPATPQSRLPVTLLTIHIPLEEAPLVTIVLLGHMLILAQPISAEPTDWRKAAEAWARLKQREAGWANAISPSGSVTPRQDANRSTPRSGGAGTPRYDEGRKTPRGSSRNGMPLGPSAMGGYQSVQGSQKSPRVGSATPRSTPSGRDSARSTPHTNTSPRSMVESSIGGDATPLYDEN